VKLTLFEGSLESCKAKYEYKRQMAVGGDPR